jgi:hypothetical protein
VATLHKRVVFHAPGEIIEWLRSESERTGVLVSEILRRLVTEKMKEEKKP